AEARAEQALKAFVRRSTDRRLEQTVGSSLGLKAVFAGMERQYVPERAGGFAGDIQYDLRGADGRVRSWTVTVGPSAAQARPGASTDAKLKITVSVADFARIAGQDLDPVKAVLTGRLELAGDFAVAMRLGEMFGQERPGRGGAARPLLPLRQGLVARRRAPAISRVYVRPMSRPFVAGGARLTGRGGTTRSARGGG
ncbi:MAG: sterol transfer family, partial [Baekduia sp.]|nr:sterol transfer family [Baekduia sp.]